MARVSYFALECTQNDHTFYISVMKSSDLEEMCFVSRRKDDGDKGFQRLLSEKRAKEIAKYLDNNKGVIPSALIVSAQPCAKLEYDKTSRKLVLVREKNSLLVLDGQHRLFGMKYAQKEYEIPVVVFSELTTQEEIRQFIDINTTQKGVPTALILDIKGPAGTESKIEERQRKLFDSLNKDSVVAGLMLSNESKTGKISRTTFNSATKIIFESGPVSSQSDEKIYRAVKNYLEAVVTVFRMSEKNSAKITKNILFKAFMSMFNDVIEKCISAYGNIKTESLVTYMRPLKELPYDDYTGTNKATETRIINDIKSALRPTVELGEEVF